MTVLNTCSVRPHIWRQHGVYMCAFVLRFTHDRSVARSVWVSAPLVKVGTVAGIGETKEQAYACWDLANP